MKGIQLLLLLFICHSLETNAQTRWSFELQAGVVHNLRLPLIIRQAGYPDIVIRRANFYSEPLSDPWYGVWRFSKWFKKRSVEFEYTHHKLYLKDNPPEVEHFGISHGFNMLTLNHGIEKGKFIFRGGLGSVLIHPESTIRGMEYPVGPGFDWKGYRLRGVMMNLAVARQMKINKTFFINSEFKAGAAIVNAPIVLGHARVHVVVFQLTLGPGFNFFVRNEE